MSELLTVGTRIYNGGDMANQEHFGTIAEVKTDRWGTQYRIHPDADSDRPQDYWIPPCMFSEKYLGHGGTRFVTEAAYRAWRADQMERLKQWTARTVQS